MRRGPGRRRHLVLLVDPDTTWRTALALGLREAGFEVREVKGSDEAHGMLDRGRDLPHLVIAETGLEGTDGFTFCGELRADMATARVPVLLLSREQEEFHRDLAGGVGADDWLPRPVAVRDVVDLARLMAGRCASEPYESHTARLPLAHAVRALLAGTRSGRVVLRESDGWLTFRHGLVVDAAFAGQHGAVALRRLLCFGTGAYTVGFGPEPLRGPALLDREQLLTQVLPALERFEALRTVGLPLAARLTVDFTQLSSQLAALPVDVNTLLRLLDGRRTVRTVLLESPFSETVAYEALIRLYMLGVLVPACLVEERERARGGEAPRFPEPTLEADSVYPPLGH
jgi:CheY-like chemotaxis protein